jgi:D-arabinose 1-dehydrogenase-like Zn-dependent alcohol dehydrogenase
MHLGCGNCEFCLNGQDNIALNWHLLGEGSHRGTYAEYVCLPAPTYKLPDDFDFHASAKRVSVSNRMAFDS